jgi:hypothetical protein
MQLLEAAAGASFKPFPGGTGNSKYPVQREENNTHLSTNSYFFNGNMAII